MFCPVCKSEYRDGYARCADCDVPLVDVLENEPESLEHAALALLWRSSDARENSQVRQALERERIPFRVQSAGPNVLNLSNQAAAATYVPQAMLDRARSAIVEAIGEEIDPAAESSESEDGDEFELSAEGDGARADNDAALWNPADWNPDEATAKIWENAAGTGSDAIIISLEENRIHWRANDPDNEGDEAITEIYVMPQDEARARKIIREVTEATPPG